MSGAPRRIWLCADDYGMAPGVNRAIRTLIAHGRLNATSVMTAAAHLGHEADELARLNAGTPRALIGLHVTLTAPFKPLSTYFSPLRHSAFPPMAELMRLAMTRRLKRDDFADEIAAQLEAFRALFGRAPDFVDGHQHAHLLPLVRDAFLAVVGTQAPQAWVRQCARTRRARPLHDRKSLVLDLLSVRFRAKAKRLGVRTNPAFAGAYAFTPTAEFATIFPRFLTGLPDGGLIMCHPGFVDPALKSLDSLTDLREREFDYFDSDAFPRDLARHHVELARPAGETGPAA
jgi:hypothetical protein